MENKFTINIKLVNIMQRSITPEKIEKSTSGWEMFWNKASKLSYPIVWDCNPELASASDLPRFQNLMNPELPLIDFACGNGTQTRFLANYFSRLIGVDISSSAIEVAKKQNAASNIEYRVLDGLQPEQAAILHSEIGDTNIYMRTGFHHILKESRPDVARSLEILLGNTGTLYLIEFGENALIFFKELLEKLDKPPQELSMVLEHELKPGTVTIEDIIQFFPNFDIVLSGEDTLGTIMKFPNGEYVRVPGIYAVLKRK